MPYRSERQKCKVGGKADVYECQDKKETGFYDHSDD